MTEHYDKIKRLYSKFLSPHISLEYPEGWNKIVDSLFESIETHFYAELAKDNYSTNIPLFSQLKEKYGGGRFYINDPDLRNEPKEVIEALYKIITLHEERCSCTCQVCGSNDASLKLKGYLLATRCASHSLESDGWSVAQGWRSPHRL